MSSKPAPVKGRTKITDTPPKAFGTLHEAFIEKTACGRQRHIFRVGDVYCVARTPLQVKDAYFDFKQLVIQPLTNPQIRKMLAGEELTDESCFGEDFAD